jgi:hypothetical protein
MNRDLMQMLEETLRIGPAVVLTNGLFFDTPRCRGLSALADASEYSLDLRVSLDGWEADDHDRIRGRGTWARTVEGIGRLCEAGLNPVITVTEAAEGVGSSHGRAGFLERLRGIGLHRPRLKILPMWRIGAEVERRGGGYEAWERLTADSVDAAGIARLQCAGGRMITSRGVYVCPILIDEPRARMGATLSETLRPFSLDHGACHTCYVTGVSCRN